MIVRLQDTVTPTLRELAAQLQRPFVLVEAAAKAVQVEIKAHLKQLQARGNARGWPPAKFFAGKPTSVDKSVGIVDKTDTSLTVEIADVRFVHRIFGGTVTPKRAKALAIPLTAKAYAMQGKGTLRESWPGLVMVKTKSGTFLGEFEAQKTGGRKGKAKAGPKPRQILTWQFKLVSSVTHKAHPEEMPDKARLVAAGTAAMEKVAQRLIAAKPRT